MANKGRSGNSSFTPDQLHAFGVTNNKGKFSLFSTFSKNLTLSCITDSLPVQAGPPPLFPTLLSKPVKLKLTSYTSDKLVWDEALDAAIKETPYFLSKLNDSVLGSNEKSKPNFIYNHMPAELRPNFSKKNKVSDGDPKPAKKSKEFDLETRLKMLEQKELLKVKEEPKVKEEVESEEEEPENDQFDTEMDDENDYGNNYFDNGEAFNEEDDLDDGPIY